MLCNIVPVLNARHPHLLHISSGSSPSCSLPLFPHSSSPPEKKPVSRRHTLNPTTPLNKTRRREVTRNNSELFCCCYWSLFCRHVIKSSCMFAFTFSLCCQVVCFIHLFSLSSISPTLFHSLFISFTTLTTLFLPLFHTSTLLYSHYSSHLLSLTPSCFISSISQTLFHSLLISFNTLTTSLLLLLNLFLPLPLFLHLPSSLFHLFTYFIHLSTLLPLFSHIIYSLIHTSIRFISSISFPLFHYLSASPLLPAPPSSLPSLQVSSFPPSFHLYQNRLATASPSPFIAPSGSPSAPLGTA